MAQLSWKDKGGRLSTSRIVYHLKKARDEQDRTALAKAHEEILVHIQGRVLDKRKLVTAMEKSSILWFYLAAKGWLPQGPIGPFKS